MNLESLGINMSDYQNSNLLDKVLYGNANITQEQLMDLSKALEAQEITGQGTLNSTQASGAPLKVESLDKVLKVITFKEAEIMLWKKIPKLNAFNTVEEYNQLVSYGSTGGSFIREGELPSESDSTYVRRSQLVKFLGTVGSVTHPMTLVNVMVGNVIDLEIRNKTLKILRDADYGVAFADSNMIPEQFNGFYSQHQNNDSNYSSLNAYLNNNASVVDLRGASLTEGNIEDAAEAIIENHGFGTDFFAPPKVLSGFVKEFYGNKFIMPNTVQVSEGIMGQRVQMFDGQYGRLALNYDIFLNGSSPKAYNAGSTDPMAPGAPTASCAAYGSPTPDPNSLFSASDNGESDAGNYYYGVVAQNRYGQSPMTVCSGGPVDITAGLSSDITITAATGANQATCFIVYRTLVNASATSTFYPLFTVSTAQVAAGYDGAAATKVRDNNRWVANTQQAFLIQNDEECWAIKQLAPLMKMDLAIISPAYRFMVLLYMTMMLYAPLKATRLINIGPYVKS